MSINLTVVDDFYDDPYKVRKLALSSAFDKPAWKLFPGREAVAENKDHGADFLGRIREFIGEPCLGANPRTYEFPQGKFNLALAADEETRGTRVHVDLNYWAAVIYLSLPEHCQGGTAWYRHRSTSALTDTAEWHKALFGHLDGESVEKVRAAMLKVSLDRDQWEEIARVEMRFNRAVIFEAHTFHATASLFGDRPENGRLTQNFEFYK